MPAACPVLDVTVCPTLQLITVSPLQGYHEDETDKVLSTVAVLHFT